MRQKSLVLLVPLILLTIIGTCQSDSLSIKAIYDKEAIYFSGNKYVKSNILYPRKELINEFQENTEAYFLYRSYKKDHRKGKVYYVVTMLLTLFAAPIIDEDVGKGALTVGIVSGVVTIRLFARADNKLKKAVWLRNRDVLLQ